jgi:hypothetical protein
MRILTSLSLTLICLLFYGCAGADHAFAGVPEGKNSTYLIEKFGYPSEVKKSAMGAETWIYQTGGRSGSWEYTLKDGTIVNHHYVSSPALH